jgi:hypothetical protein
MAEAHSPEESARYVVTIFKRLRCVKNETALMGNLTLPFSQDGWTKDELTAGLAYGIEQGWIEAGKAEKFFKLTEAGFAQYAAVAD